MKRQVSAERRIWKVIQNILLVPIWIAAKIISWFLSMTLVVTTWAFRTCCIIGFAVGIICLIMGAIRDWWQSLLLFGAVGIVWLIPYGINAMAEMFDTLAEMIVDFWHTPPKPGKIKPTDITLDDNKLSRIATVYESSSVTNQEVSNTGGDNER